jgi:chromatin segregation and condensation protein Rec8/ScpA/Scc1 (kleisin family)
LAKRGVVTIRQDGIFEPIYIRSAKADNRNNPA